MPNFYYVSGALGAPELLENHNASVQALVSGDYNPSDLEMLKGHHGVYSLRINRGQRLIFTVTEAAGRYHLLLLDYLPTHDYNKCRYLNPQVLKHYVLKQQDMAEAAAAENALEFEAISDDDSTDVNLNAYLAAHKDEAGDTTSQPAYYYKEQMVVLNPIQAQSLELRMPAIVSGVAGSGKSCVALAALAKAALNRGDDRPIWYMTQSCLLVEDMKAQWATRVDEKMPPIEFMTYNHFLERHAGVLPTVFVDEQTFTPWYETYLRRQKKITRTAATAAIAYPDSRRAYQEFRLCSAYTKDEYCALGTRQSRIEKTNRAALYETYVSYNAYLESEKKIDPAFYDVTIEDAPCSMVVVDEAQDFSTKNLSTLHAVAAGQVLYCMDSHQRVEDDMSVGPFLKERFKIADASSVELVATYRCPLKVISAANEVIRLKHQLSGGTIDKDEVLCVSGMGDEKALGALHHVEDERTLFADDIPYTNEF
jgi:hypothetical protein